MDFKCSQTVAPQVTTLTISGYVNEQAKFPSVKEAPFIRIVLKDVKGLNSIGTRSWLIWIKNGLPDVPISITHAPPLFVKMFGEVLGTLSTRIKVDSFYIPYYSEESGERQDVLFERGQHFDNEGNVNYPEVKDSSGRILDIDVLPNFFNFLKAHK